MRLALRDAAVPRRRSCPLRPTWLRQSGDRSSVTRRISRRKLAQLRRRLGHGFDQRVHLLHRVRMRPAKNGCWTCLFLRAAPWRAARAKARPRRWNRPSRSKRRSLQVERDHHASPSKPSKQILVVLGSRLRRSPFTHGPEQRSRIPAPGDRAALPMSLQSRLRSIERGPAQRDRARNIFRPGTQLALVASAEQMRLQLGTLSARRARRCPWAHTTCGR